MKLSMFNTKEERTEYLLNMAKAIEDNGLRIAKKNLEDAKKGIGKEEFIKVNKPIDPDAEWMKYIIWLIGDVEYLEKKVRRLRKQAMA